MKQPIYIGIGSQKGGVGKSTIAELLAGILYYEKEYSLIVLDCDLAQNSFYKLRERDLHYISGESLIGQELKHRFEAYNKEPYPILKTTASEALVLAGKQDSVDLILFDLPGRCDTTELLELSISLDYLISPIEPDIQSLTSCVTYASTVQSAGVELPTARIRDVYMLWNKVDPRVRKDTIENYNTIMKSLDLKVLESVLYLRKKYSLEVGEARSAKEVFRSTYVCPTEVQRAGTGINELLTELQMLNLFNLNV